jgi:hypothetical protein
MSYYSVYEVPSAVQIDMRKQWMVAWNASYRQDGDEGRAFAAAWASIQKTVDIEMSNLIEDIEDTTISKLIRDIESRFGFVL